MRTLFLIAAFAVIVADSATGAELPERFSIKGKMACSGTFEGKRSTFSGGTSRLRRVGDRLLVSTSDPSRGLAFRINATVDGLADRGALEPGWTTKNQKVTSAHLTSSVSGNSISLSAEIHTTLNGQPNAYIGKHQLTVDFANSSCQWNSQDDFGVMTNSCTAKPCQILVP